MSDMFNGLMVIPNLIALLALTGTVKAVYHDYIEKNGGK
ncbi:alanine:cation symporter family protein [Terrisporobacter sp.]